MNKTQVERTRRLRESNSKKGLRQVTVWVPEQDVAYLKQLAQMWRNSYAEGRQEECAHVFDEYDLCFECNAKKGE